MISEEMGEVQMEMCKILDLIYDKHYHDILKAIWKEYKPICVKWMKENQLQSKNLAKKEVSNLNLVLIWIYRIWN